MSLLSVIQDVISENGFGARPVSIIGNSDALAVQCLALCQSVVDDVIHEYTWQSQISTLPITTVASQESYFLENYTSAFQGFIPDSAWDFTNNLPLTGPLTEERYAALVNGIFSSSALNRYWIRTEDFIKIYPTPTTSGDHLRFRFISTFGVKVVLGVADYDYAERFTADTNSTVFPERLLRLGLNWKLRKAKGFDYAEEFNLYEKGLSLAKAHDKGARTLNFSAPPAIGTNIGNFPPTIVVP